MEKGKPVWWDEAIIFLKKDSLLGPIVEKYHDGFLEGQGDLFSTLARSIVGQQISVLAADSIWARLVDLVGEMKPENILKFTPEQLAKCGITGPKSRYIHGIAQDSERFIDQDYENMSDKDVKKHFISFKGIGPWTAEMLMIFALMRPDIFSIGDLGLVKAIQILQPNAESKESIEKIAEQWAPYRTAACWYLWRMLDPVPVAY
jgi:DNA-3-methyladenine glycosylase II